MSNALPYWRADMGRDNGAAKVSVTQIAARAGVSIATVSRVINNSRPVKSQVATLVRTAMQDLKFSPRLSRRKDRINASKSRTIAIISGGVPYCEWFQIPVLAAAVAGIHRAAHDANVGVRLAELTDASQLPALCKQDI